MKAPKSITAGEWIAARDPDSLYDTDWCIGTSETSVDHIAVCFERDAKMLAASKKLAEALNAMVIIAEVNGWAEAVTGRQVALSEARAALYAAGYED